MTMDLRPAMDLLNFESRNETSTPDIDEVCNYIDALNYALGLSVLQM
jgi:hypothetical protein